MFFGCLYLFLRLIIKCQIIGQIETNVPSLGLCDSWSPLQQTCSPLSALVGGSVLTSYVTSHPFPHLIKEFFVRIWVHSREGEGQGGFHRLTVNFNMKNKQTNKQIGDGIISTDLNVLQNGSPHMFSIFSHVQLSCSNADVKLTISYWLIKSWHFHAY